MPAITLSPSAPTVTLTGLTTAYGTIGSYYLASPPGPLNITTAVEAAVFGTAGTNFNVLNTGTVTSTGTSQFDAGIVLGSPGEVTNTGTIIAPSGIFILSDGAGAYAANHGYIHATSFTGMYDQGAGGVANFGTIVAKEVGINGGYGLVNNVGTIIASEAGIFQLFGSGVNSGVILTSTFVSGHYTYGGSGVVSYGTFTNISTGTISAPAGSGLFAGFFSAAYNEGAITGAYGAALDVGASVYNTGIITGSQVGIFEGRNYDLEVGGYSYITNYAAGRITGASYGILVTLFSHAIIYNAGYVSGATAVQDFGNVTNAGTLAGITLGVQDFNATLTNSGLITGATGGTLGNESYVNNTGLISGSSTGLLLQRLYGTDYRSALGVYCYNYTGGTIAGGQFGIAAARVGTLAIPAGVYNYGGTIIGGVGVSLISGGIINTGAIIGTAGTAIEFSQRGTVTNGGVIDGAINFGAGRNRLILRPGALISGTVNLAGGTLELTAYQAQAGTLVASEAQNAHAITLDKGAGWMLASGISLAGTIALTNQGTLAGPTSGALAIAGKITGKGDIEMPATLTLGGAVAAGQTLIFNGASQTLNLGDANAFAAKLEHFAAADTIDLTGIALSSITATHFAGGVLTLTETTGTLTFTFASPKSFLNETFSLFAGAAGTAITLSPAPTQIQKNVGWISNNFVAPTATTTSLVTLQS